MQYLAVFVLLYCYRSFVEFRQASCSLIAGETHFAFSSHDQIVLIDTEVEVWWLIFCTAPCLKRAPASLMLLGFSGPSLRVGRDGPSASKHSEPKLWPSASSSCDSLHLCLPPQARPITTARPPARAHHLQPPTTTSSPRWSPQSWWASTPR